MPRDASFYIVDIFISIFQIDYYTKSFDNAEDLKWNMLEWDATLRKLEIIGEATKHLISMEVLDNTEYRKIVDFRNLISHGYFGIDEEEVWYVITYKLKEFEEELNTIIEDRQIDIHDAILFAQKENSKHKQIIDFLNNLQ